MNLQKIKIILQYLSQKVAPALLQKGLAKASVHMHTLKKRATKGLVGKATAYLWKHSWLQFLGISVVIAFLLFFLHLFLTSAYLTQKASADISQRLGFYFYINEPGQQGTEQLTENDIYNRVMHLKDELTSSGLSVEYYSKDDALKLLQQRIP